MRRSGEVRNAAFMRQEGAPEEICRPTHWRPQLSTFNHQEVLLFHPVEVRPGAEEERLAGHRWRRHEAVFELALSQLLKFAVLGNHRGLSFLAEEVNAPFGGKWRGRIVSADALIPDNRAGPG